MAAGRRGSRRAQQEASKVQPEATAETAARPRQQARGRRPAARPAGADSSAKARSAAVVVTEAEVLEAVASLYADELKPVGRILKKRIAELRSADAKDNQKATSVTDIEQLRSLCDASKSFRVEPEEGGDFFAMLAGRKHSFVDIYDSCDVYPTELWSELLDYCESPLGQEMSLPGGRYACAQALESYSLPCLADYSLGHICHIVQLAITQKKILGYLNGAVVAYGKSQSKLKEHLALTGHPVCPTDEGVETMPIASLDVARSCMQQILKEASGQLPLSNVKRFFRSKCNAELSETSLGYAKLSELLRGSHFRDICIVELRESGYVVIQVEDASGSVASTEPPTIDDVASETQASCSSGDEGTDVFLGRTDEAKHESFCPDEPLNFDTSSIVLDREGTGEPGTKAATWQPLTPGMLAEEGFVIHNTFFDIAPALPTPIRTGAARRAKSLPKEVGCRNASSEDDAATIDLADAQTENLSVPAKTPQMISPSLVSPNMFWPPSAGLMDDSHNSFVWSMPWTQEASYEPIAPAMDFNNFSYAQPPQAALGNTSNFVVYLDQHL